MLYPYIKEGTSSWEERYIYDIFKVDIGGKESITLHREQSLLLKQLIEGKNIALSAPTSFGKSFIIDAFIAIKNLNNVVIIVPTISLMDETRRRIYKKFSNQYKIITTTDIELEEKNIFIFPQERAIHYVDKIDNIDIFIVDEFYKASTEHDKERSPTLLKAIIKLGNKSKQKYFLAPNISSIKDNIFTKDMIFQDKLDFNTVYLKKINLYEEIKKDKAKKEATLLKILDDATGKSIIYFKSSNEIIKVSELLIDKVNEQENEILNQFSNWLQLNYSINWGLVKLIKKGVGIHHGKQHRCISQIQIKLFEDANGIKNILCTSSIIEGVNTSAENVIIWSNRSGNFSLSNFTYKNITGRAGRMFKHFVGNIYILEKPKDEEKICLEIEFPDSILPDLDNKSYSQNLNNEQISKIIAFRERMNDLIGKDSYKELLKENIFQSHNPEFIEALILQMLRDKNYWSGLSFLNNDNLENWDNILFKILRLKRGEWGIQYTIFIKFIKNLSFNWNNTIPEILELLNMSMEEFFYFEKKVVFELSALIKDINILQKEIINNGIDVSPFLAKISYAFLPPVVYQLEEYGLPRMISKKLHINKIMDFSYKNTESDNIHDVIKKFNDIGKNKMLSMSFLDDFDKYIIDYFYDGITYCK